LNTWANNAVFYHIYPLGLCGAPEWNAPGVAAQNRLDALHRWIPHIRELGVNAVYLGPVFESCRHGYDTTDYCTVDRRLGTNDALRRLVAAFHENGIRVVLDGVFNHVGREFLAFKDVQARREQSTGKNWFRSVNFKHNNGYNDGFSYVAWRGCDDLVELNLENPEVVAYLMECVTRWVGEFDIDGIRLDAADCLDVGFLRRLRQHTATLKKDFWLMGEVLLSGGYAPRLGDDKLDSVTNYEVYKGLYSSHNDRNYYEIAHSLNRMFGAQGILKGQSLFNFVDNHDVSRIASVLRKQEHAVPLHILLFTIPGIPSIYYGSEWGIPGRKEDGDAALRPCLDPGQMKDTELTRLIARLAMIRKETPALQTGDYWQAHVSGEVFAFTRQAGQGQAVVAVNSGREPADIHLKVQGMDNGVLHDALDGEKEYRVANGTLQVTVKGCSGAILRDGETIR
jgi:glycosidase